MSPVRGAGAAFPPRPQHPAPESGPHPSRSSITSGPPHPHRARGPEPVPDASSTRRAWGPLTARSRAGRCRPRPAPSSAPAPLGRRGHPIHPAAVPANHRAPLAPPLVMGGAAPGARARPLPAGARAGRGRSRAAPASAPRGPCGDLGGGEEARGDGAESGAAWKAGSWVLRVVRASEEEWKVVLISQQPAPQEKP